VRIFYGILITTASPIQNKQIKNMRKLIFIVLVSLRLGSQAAIPYPIFGYVYDQTGSPLMGVSIAEIGTKSKTTTDKTGYFSLTISEKGSKLAFEKAGFESQEIIADQGEIRVNLFRKQAPVVEMEILMDQEAQKSRIASGQFHPNHYTTPQLFHEQQNTEEYANMKETGFKRASDHPLSTFSIDVDAASYSNVRRFIMNGQLPPKDAVRVEEMINYFDYNWSTPNSGDAFAIHTDMMKTPWNDQHYLAQIAIKGKEIDTENLPASNLVFLIDVSGSMNQQNKLPLLKSSMKMLVNQLRSIDKVAIVVYAGAAGLVLPSMPGNEKQIIFEALDKLQAGGSTAGGAGIQLAYQTAKSNFVLGGNNRIILATDGDFNVGESSNEAMENLITEKRKEGVFLTVLGFGMGNYKDSKMEILADKGNGNYAYIDNLTEAHKVLVSEFGGTLYTIAKDVKIQVEFNPAYVKAYRLVGYENRRLQDEDFNNDKVDAGELGSGHTVIALYEIVPIGSTSSYPGSIDPLKYQNEKSVASGVNNGEMFTVKFRYKKPNQEHSSIIVKTVPEKLNSQPGENLRWAAAVAGFGLLLSGSDYSNHLNYSQIQSLAVSARGTDLKGYRSEMIRLVELASQLENN